MSTEETLEETAQEYLAARKIIGETIKHYLDRPFTDGEAPFRVAESIIARLTHNKPPLLIVFDHNVKD